MIVEIGKLKLKSGVSDEQFIELQKNIRNGKLKEQLGFISHELGKDENGFWYLKINWESKELADKWIPIFKEDPNGQAVMNVVDFSSVRQEHYTVINP